MAILSVKDLGFTYLGAKQPAIQDLAFQVEAGTITAVVGANGAGKSTLCYALAGFIPHYFKGTLRGSVHVDGLNTASTPLADLVTHCALTFQNPFNQISGANLTVAEEIAFGLENLGVPRPEMQTRVANTMDLFGLTALAEKSPFALSGGEQQRLALASVFVMDAPVMVLDEPTAQLDPLGTQQVMETISALSGHGRTIVFVEHKLEWVARLATHVLVLQQGKLVAEGAPRDILAHAADWGLTETRYARAARTAVSDELVASPAPLPQTLEQAVEFFRGARAASPVS